MIKTSNICTLCPAEDTSVYDYEQLIVHLNDDHKIVQKHVFLVALIVADYEKDELLQDLMIQLEERVKDILETEEETEEVALQEDCGTNDDLRNNLRDEIIRRTEVPNDVNNIQAKIQEELDSSSDEEDEEPNTIRTDPQTQEKELDSDLVKEEVQDEEVEQVIKEKKVEGINLVEKFAATNMCRLCYTQSSDKKKHEALEHADDQEALERTHFTLKDLTFHCSIPTCKKIAFLSMNLLQKHEMKLHKMQRNVTCQICQKSLLPSQIKKHILKHENEIRCKLCYKLMKTEQSKLIHYDKVHKNDEYLEKEISPQDLRIPCNKCEYKFVSEANMNIHTKAVHDQVDLKQFYDMKTRKFHCKLCHEMFNYNYKLNKHLNFYHPSDKNLLNSINQADFDKECDKCDLKFLTETLADFHRLRIHFPNMKKVPCSLCDKEISRYNYAMHKATHTLVKNFNCNLCQTKFKTKQTLERHQAILHGTPEERQFIESGQDTIPQELLKYPCPECHLSFLSQSLLTTHENGNHREKVSEYECHICYKKMKSKYNIKAHLENVHKDEKQYWFKPIPSSDSRFSCGECPKMLISQHVLNLHTKYNHQSAHSVYQGECHICYLKIGKYNVKGHLQRMHQREKDFWFKPVPEDLQQFTCKECDKGFVSVSVLNQHTRIQHRKFDSKSAECHICYIKLANKYTIKVHLNKVHKTEKEFWFKEIPKEKLLFGCSKCDKKFLTKMLQKRHSRQHNNMYNFLYKSSYDKTTNTYKCKLCQKENKQFDNLKKHFASTHEEDLELLKKDVIRDKDLTFHCSEENCVKKFPSLSSLSYHRKDVHGQKVSSKKKIKLESKERYCQLCSILYKKPFFLQAHKQRVHSSELDMFDKELTSEDLKYSCQRCKKKFYTENTLSHHVNKKHNQNKGSTKDCKLCNTEFKTPQKFYNHKYKIHKEELDLFRTQLNENDFTFACGECPKRFPSKGSHAYHLEVTHKVSYRTESVKECGLCYDMFKSTSILKAHVKNCHQEDLQSLNQELPASMLKYQCQSCDLKFLSIHILKYHTKKAHESKLTFCKLCRVNFKNNFKLKTHRTNVHTSQEEIEALNVKSELSGLKEACRYCNDKFLNANVLRYHITYSHKEEKKQDIVCDICNQVFKFDNNRQAKFTRHMKNHNDSSSSSGTTKKSVKNMTVENFMSFFNSLTEQ